jgi:putative two-component system response regulator
MRNQNLMAIWEAWPGQLSGAWNVALQEQAHPARMALSGRTKEERADVVSAIEPEPYQIVEADGAESLLRITKADAVDLIVIRSSVADEESLDCCRRIRSAPATRMIPILAVSGARGEPQECWVEAGVDEVMPTPLNPVALRIRLRWLLGNRRKRDQLEESESILLTLARAVEQRDCTTAFHCERLALFSVAMGVAMGLGPKELLALKRGGYLHDIGKVAIPDSILFKAGPLDEDEWRVMRSHPLRGEAICQPLQSLEPVLPIIRSHHERWDGSGYPDGLNGERIPLLARVLQLADIFDALTTVRPYKTAIANIDALAIMEQQTVRGWHDPGLMRLFARLPHAELQQAALQAATGGDEQSLRRSLAKLRLAVG